MFLFIYFLSVWVKVNCALRDEDNKTFSLASSNNLLEKYFWRNATTPVVVKTTEASLTMHQFPTATWSAATYEEQRKMLKPEASKLYLFKPSPFLKPPFTEGHVGASISGIEDGVDVMGRRSGKPARVSSDRRIAVEMQSRDQDAMEDNSHDAMQLDLFLEQSLGKYLESSNLDKIFGPISVEVFSEALKRVILEKMSKAPLYDRNKDLRRKFRDEVLFPKKAVSTEKPASSVLEKLYMRRLQKTWQIINETSTAAATTMNIDDHMDEWFPTESTTELVSEEESNFDYGYATPATATESVPITTTVPTRLGRGRTKYRDTVQNSIDDEAFDDSEVQLTAAETIYYRSRAQSVNTFTYKQDSFGAIPGEPGKDYPMFSSPPRSGFKCPRVRSNEHKMIADRNTRCQVFYICKGNAPPSPMLCPNGTMFNEDVLVCDWWYNVDC